MRTTVLLLAGALIALLFTSCNTGATGESAAAQPTPPVELVLELLPGRIWSASLVNRGDEPIVVVLPGDGSSRGRRTPIVKWVVVTESGILEPYNGGGCGMINPLNANEVVTLGAGESVSINRYGLLRPRLPRNGIVSVSLTYENIPDLVWPSLLLGLHDPEIMLRVRASAPLSLKSNVVQFDVQAKE